MATPNGKLATELPDLGETLESFAQDLPVAAPNGTRATELPSLDQGLDSLADALNLDSNDVNGLETGCPQPRSSLC